MGDPRETQEDSMALHYVTHARGGPDGKGASALCQPGLVLEDEDRFAPRFVQVEGNYFAVGRKPTCNSCQRAAWWQEKGPAIEVKRRARAQRQARRRAA